VARIPSSLRSAEGLAGGLLHGNRGAPSPVHTSNWRAACSRNIWSPGTTVLPCSARGGEAASPADCRPCPERCRPECDRRSSTPPRAGTCLAEWHGQSRRSATYRAAPVGAFLRRKPWPAHEPDPARFRRSTRGRLRPQRERRGAGRSAAAIRRTLAFVRRRWRAREAATAGASALSPRHLPAFLHTVFTAPMRLASESTLSRYRRIFCLCGMVTLNPAMGA